jgi:hypothetical protein
MHQHEYFRAAWTLPDLWCGQNKVGARTKIVDLPAAELHVPGRSQVLNYQYLNARERPFTHSLPCFHSFQSHSSANMSNHIGCVASCRVRNWKAWFGLVPDEASQSTLTYLLHHPLTRHAVMRMPNPNCFQSSGSLDPH